jgi:hypothetical protein
MLRSRWRPAWIAPDNATRSRTGADLDDDWLVILALARRQEGTVGRWQILAHGIEEDRIDALVRARRLLPVEPGVYTIGSRVVTAAARYWIAVLACGPDALLDARPALVAHGVMDDHPALRPVVIVPPDQRPRRGRVRVRRAVVPAVERTTARGLPVVRPGRAVLDTAATEGALVAERAWRALVHHGRLDLEEMLDVVARHEGERGVVVVRALIARRRELVGIAESELEEREAACVIAASLPVPERNVPVVLSGGRKVWFDLVVRSMMLAVEADGPYHDDPEVAAEDARRDAEAAHDGWTTVRGHHSHDNTLITANVRRAAETLLRR